MDYIFSSANPRIEPIYFVIAGILALLAGTVTGHYRRQGRMTKAQSIAVVLLTVYLFLVFASTLFSRIPNEYYSYELIPFWSYWEILNGSRSLLWEDVLNVIMLLPMGILLPIAMKDDAENKGFPRAVLFGVLTSLTIEFLQLVMKRGLFEFDDMFHNTLGVVIGYWLYWKMRKNRK